MTSNQELADNFRSFISYSGILCFFATLVVAQRFFVLPTHNVGFTFRRNIPSCSKGLVMTLCVTEGLHCYLAYVSKDMSRIGWVKDASLTFIQLTYLSTAFNVYICQVNLVSTLNQALSSKAWKLFWHMVPPIIATINSAVFGLSDDPFSMDIILGEYFHLMTLPVYLWKAGEIISPSEEQCPETTTTDMWHVFFAPTYALSIYGLIVGIVSLNYFMINSPPIFWAYVDLATYELFGNLYPLILISLMCGMHLAGFEDRAEVENQDYKTFLIQK